MQLGPRALGLVGVFSSPQHTFSAAADDSRLSQKHRGQLYVFDELNKIKKISRFFLNVPFKIYEQINGGHLVLARIK